MKDKRQTQEHFIPALAYRSLTPYYDMVMQTLLRENSFKQRLIQLAEIEGEQRVLDLGCGTATLTMQLKRQYSQTTVIGIDADRDVLALARKKIAQAGLQILLDEGTATALPYADTSFDRVLSSLFFHHLSEQQAVQAAREAFRVLKPGGQLLMADWGKAENMWMRLAFLGVQVLDGFANTQKNVTGSLPAIFLQAGFMQVQQVTSYRTLFGTLALYRVKKA